MFVVDTGSCDADTGSVDSGETGSVRGEEEEMANEGDMGTDSGSSDEPL